MADANENTGSKRSMWIAGLAVVAIFALALFLRAYWNFDAARNNGDFLLSGGSDGYYIKRTVDYVQSHNWKQLVHDPMLNYPFGATNPNPPLWVYTLALAGTATAPLFHGDVATSTWYATIWGPALFGALTVIPVYLLGATLWNRRAGLVAAFLLAIAPNHIDQTSLGDARHYAMALFWIMLSAFFYVKAVKSVLAAGSRVWVDRWPADMGSGLGAFWREKKGALGWAALGGLALGADALMWKGFPYMAGIVLGYAVLQMIVDHWKNRDSTGLFLTTLVFLLVGTLVGLPYYTQTGLFAFIEPVFYMIAAFLVVGVVLVPTRDLPSLLVMPLFAIAAIVVALVAFFAIPAVSRTLLYSFLYFQQSTLYTTIAEAHPSDFNTMAFSVGPVVYFLGLFGIVALFVKARKNPDRPYLFMAIWGLIAIYMAASAVRFLFNMTPVFSLIGGWVVVWFLDWVGFGTIRKNMSGAGSFWAGARRSITGWHVFGVVMVTLLLVVPNVFLAVDAATPPQAEQQIAAAHPGLASFIQTRFGAFGSDFLPDYWNQGLLWLAALPDQRAQYTADISSGEVDATRPAVLSWWDYGHWEIAIAHHPAVADNFQNGYEFAAAFLLAQNETHALQLLSARQVPLFLNNRDSIDGTQLTRDDLVAILQDPAVGVASNDTDATIASLTKFQYAPALGSEVKANALVEKIEAKTGYQIRYFATDIRMLPYDDPNTAQIDHAGIFQAPVILAGQNPDDYVQVLFHGTTANAQTGSPYYTEAQLTAARKDLNNANLQVDGEKFEYSQKFFQSMFYRGYLGSPLPSSTTFPVEGSALNSALNLPQPGYAMKHFRLVYLNDQLRILQYFPGAPLTGKVTENGQPVVGASVTVYDDAGQMLLSHVSPQLLGRVKASDLAVPHDTTFTGADGSYSLVAPFSTNTTDQVIVSQGSVELARGNISVSQAEAETGVAKSLDFTIQRGEVKGVTFYDKDADGVFNTSKGDFAVPHLAFKIGGANGTSDASGAFDVPAVPPGPQPVTVNSTQYTVGASSGSIGVKPGPAVTAQNISLALATVTVSGTVGYDSNGNGVRDANETVPNFPLAFRADATFANNTAKDSVARTDANGTYTVVLTPGDYVIGGNFTASNGHVYTTSAKLHVVTADKAALQQFNVLLVAVPKS
ncbi:MAG: STT3 domain-containing protein [Thermoplasmatota archaeon]